VCPVSPSQNLPTRQESDLFCCTICKDLPETEQILTANYADDTSILASHQNPITASRKLQNHLNQFEKWLKRWRIRANENKSTHVTFNLKRENCPTVALNGNQILQ
jgi:hypothetical protein